MSKVKHLPSSVMRSLGDTLLHNQQDIAKSSPLCAALWPSLIEAQAGIVTALASGGSSTELAALTAALQEADRRHDALVQILAAGLEVAVLLARYRGDEADAALLTSCLATLLPDGASQMLKAWHEEAGEAATLAARLTPTQADRLTRLELEGRTMRSMVTEWVASAEALGRLLNERAVSQADAKGAPSLVAARRAWGRAFDAFLIALPMAGLSDADETRLRRPFDEAVRMHQARLAAGRARGAVDAEAQGSEPVASGAEA